MAGLNYEYTPKLVVIVGPTASGKSALAMRAALELDGEIICADSRTVYRGMDIGTAKPTPEDQLQIKHHLLDVAGPQERFNAALFKTLANNAIVDITTRHKLPIMVGGSGLYIDSVLFDYQFGNVASESMRSELSQMSVDQLTTLYKKYGISLPTNPKNKRHLVRGLEIGAHKPEHRPLRNNTFVVGISTSRQILRQRITERAKKMIEDGVLQEVENLTREYNWQAEAMTGNIYKIFKQGIDSNLTLKEAIEQFIKSDMSLAKRQMTWFRRNPNIIWREDTEDILKLIKNFVLGAPQ